MGGGAPRAKTYKPYEKHNSEAMLQRPGLLFAAVLACVAPWFDAYSNDCGSYPLNGQFDESNYIRPKSAMLDARGFLMVVGLAGVPIAAAVGAVLPQYTRAAYMCFACMWVSVLLSWHSPCRNHNLEAGTYLALSSAGTAVLASVVHDY